MAISHVTINHGAIRSRLVASPFGGTVIGATHGFHHGEAVAIAERMALAARVNADRLFNQRTGSLVASVRPIVRDFGKAGVEVGVGTLVKHGSVLERGAPAHVIQPQGSGYLLRSNGPRSKGGNPDPLERPQKLVVHPGNEETNWMSDAVRSVLPGSLVIVKHFDPS